MLESNQSVLEFCCNLDREDYAWKESANFFQGFFELQTRANGTYTPFAVNLSSNMGFFDCDWWKLMSFLDERTRATRAIKGLVKDWVARRFRRRRGRESFIV